MMKHTPGPWRTDGWTITAGDTRMPINIAYTRTAIDEREEEQQANARLIAAAPDMLAALEDILARNEIQHWFNVDKARAAVEKATQGD